MEAIAHFDADAFFASVEQAADGRLRRRPVAVGGGRGVVCSASYEARAYGVRGAMPTRKALELCPELVLLRGHFDLYEQFSEHLFALCEGLTPYVERASIDEGFLDLRGRTGGMAGAMKALRGLESEVQGMLKITLSCGLSARKRIAEIAAKVHKPRGFTVVPAGNEAAFLAPLALGYLPGLGKVSCERLQGIGLRTVGDLVKTPVDLLFPILGKRAVGLLDLAGGKDGSTVSMVPAAPLSYGGQESFSESGNEAEVEQICLCLIRAQLVRLRKSAQTARRLTVVIRYTDYVTTQASHTLVEPANLDPVFVPEARRLLMRAWNRRVRLNQVRVQLDNLYPDWNQGMLFSEKTERQRQLYAVQDALNARFGTGMLGPASRLAGKRAFRAGAED
jgi:DNA polymerase-4